MDDLTYIYIWIWLTISWHSVFYFMKKKKSLNKYEAFLRKRKKITFLEKVYFAIICLKQFVVTYYKIWTTKRPHCKWLFLILTLTLSFSLNDFSTNDVNILLTTMHIWGGDQDGGRERWRGGFRGHYGGWGGENGKIKNDKMRGFLLSIPRKNLVTFLFLYQERLARQSSQCGLWSWRPARLQRLANSFYFSLALAALLLVQAMGPAYLAQIAEPLANRYGKLLLL